MNLEEIFAELRRILNLDADLAPIPLLAQVASLAENSAAVRDYNRHLETALTGEGANLGAAFVAVVAEGADAAPAHPVLDLQSLVMLSVVVNPVTNRTGLSAFQLVRRVLRIVKFARIALRDTRGEFRLGSPAYQVGPLSKGTDLYYINLQVRTSETLGALNPA